MLVRMIMIINDNDQIDEEIVSFAHFGDCASLIFLRPVLCHGSIQAIVEKIQAIEMSKQGNLLLLQVVRN